MEREIRAITGTPSFDAFLLDVRHAVRMMRRAPGFAAIAVGSSALGIGGCTVLFAILNVALLKPLPVDDPGRLMSLSEIDRRTGEAGSVLSYPDFRDLRQARSFEAVAAYDSLLTASIGLQGDPQRHWGALVTANYFAVVKPPFALGRGFDTIRDDTRGEPPVVVLSHDLWQQHFGGDPGIVGRPISINGRPTTVVGVTAAGFRGTDAGSVSEFWIPFSMIDEVESRMGPVSRNRTRYWLSVVARLRPDIEAQAARGELDIIARNLNAAFARDESRGFHLERAGQVNPGLRRMALAFFSVSLGVTALVLLTACANVANLLLGRASARRREIAARMALGASRVRLLRQLLTESLLLAFDPGLDRRPDPQSRQLLRDILERAQAVEGVESATLTTEVPLTLIVNNSRFVPEENAKDPQAQRIRTDIYTVGPRFFATMGISFLAGEDFRFDHAVTGRPAIVNDAFARAAFPNQSPIGRRLLGDGKKLEIVGLVSTAKSRTIGEAPRPCIYLPILSDYAAAQSPRGVTLIVKTRGAAATYAAPLREAIRRTERSLAVFDIRTMESHLSDALIVPRLARALSAVAGGIGLGLATIGVYGVISFVVARRRRELGIRLAIGARPREILVMILIQGITLAFIGTALGFLAALGVTRFAASLLYGVNPLDPITFVVAPSFLMAVTLVACIMPARAAARVDPVDVLRSE